MTRTSSTNLIEGSNHSSASGRQRIHDLDEDKSGPAGEIWMYRFKAPDNRDRS
jgi:hypothetical protein